MPNVEASTKKKLFLGKFLQQICEIVTSEDLAKAFNLVGSEHEADFVLEQDEELDALSVRVQSEASWKPVIFSFEDPPFLFRVKKSQNAKEPLRDLLKTKGRFHRQNILDATLGMGHDGFMMAFWGHHVTSFERNPLVFALVKLALKNFRQRCPELGVQLNWNIYLGDFSDAKLGEAFDVLYLDPMYKGDGHKALNKKELRFLSLLIGGAPADDSLIKSYLDFAAQNKIPKVILKRPLRFPCLPPPSHYTCIEGRGTSTRFDLYRGPGA